MSVSQRFGAHVSDLPKEPNDSIGNSDGGKLVQFAHVDSAFQAILLVDDVPDILEAHPDLFKALGLFLLTADSEAQAWSLWQQSLPEDKSQTN
jgi:hypothetical protein